MSNNNICDDSSVFIIDGVRPLVTIKILEDMVELNKKYEVIGSYSDCVSTILEKKDGFLKKSLVRNILAESHTPQIFKFNIFCNMYLRINDYDLENETECLNIALKYCNKKAFLYKVNRDDVMKITYKNDIHIAKQILKNRNCYVILITGGSRGIGKALASKLKYMSYQIIICSRTEADLVNVADELNIDYYVCDISNHEQVKKMFDYVYFKYNKLDFLINNASITHNITDIENLDLNIIDKVVIINFKGNLYCTQNAIKIMKKQNFGTIITIGSSGIDGSRIGQSLYICTKNALKTLSESISIEGKKQNILSFYIVPRRCDTEMRRQMYPHEDKTSLLSLDELVDNIIFVINGNLVNLSGSSFWIK